MITPSIAKYVKENWYSMTSRNIAKELNISDTQVARIAHKLKLPAKTSDAFVLELEKNNFKPPTWKHGWLKTEKTSIFVDNKEKPVSYEDVRKDTIKEMKKYSPKYPKIKRGKTEPHLLILSPSDIHINKLAVKEETGDDYNIKIALERVHSAIDKILQRAESYHPEQIILLVGNDVLHTDNNKGTTAGTPQDMDTQWHQAFKIARKMYVEIIEKLLQVSKVHIMHNPSNHDWYSGYMLSDALYCWFNKNKDVTWDIEIRHRKYFTYGKNLIGTSHGDGARENDLPMLMATEAKTWSNTKYRYFYLGHVHHKKQIKYVIGDKQQITIEYMRSPSGTDAWHDRNGYIAPKSIEGFIHHKEEGQVARITVNF